ncbi:MAG: hypothetical protein ACRDPS_16740 [Nocardioides sp.]|uniref:hypothetical protein n=1 Tax=Nocardioides sp. TaxID=35761 RepID=UPI003D6AB89B
MRGLRPIAAGCPVFRGEQTVEKDSPSAIVVAAEHNPFVVPAQRRSRVAGELRSIGEKRLAIMRISSVAVAMVEWVVVMCHAVMDDENDTDIFERLDAAMTALEAESDVTFEEVITISESQIDAIVNHVARPETRKFYRQLLGAAAYDRLAQAVKDDSATVLAATQRGLTLARPMVVAFQDSLSVLTANQIAAMGLGAPTDPAAALIRAVLQLDKVIAHVLDAMERDALDRLFPTDDDVDLDADAVLQAIEEIRPLVSQDLQRRLSLVNDALTRKVLGARDALDHSADGPAQAASSLVELIDQSLRSQLKGVDVVGWVQAKYPGSTRDLIYEKDGVLRPAKRAEVLCLVYGPDSSPDKVEPFREAAVASLVTARRALEKVKHEDADPVGDRAVVEEMMRAVHGALGLTFRFAAIRMSSSELDAAAGVLATPSLHAGELSA